MSAKMPRLPKDRMPEAEVSLRLAFYLLSRRDSCEEASVAIDGAQVRVGGRMIFPIAKFLAASGWRQTEQSGRNDWQGIYVRGSKRLDIHARSGIGDVVVTVGAKRIRAESKGGPLIRKKGSQEYPKLRELIGHLITVESIKRGDVMVAAVPASKKFLSLIDAWAGRPLVKRSRIVFASVDRKGSVKGLDL